MAVSRAYRSSSFIPDRVQGGNRRFSSFDDGSGDRQINLHYVLLTAICNLDVSTG